MNRIKFCPLCGDKLMLADERGRRRLTCRACDFVEYENPRPTVSAFIVKGDQILLSKRAYPPFQNQWDLPGGFLEAGESAEEGLLREIKEELGIEIEIKQFLGTYPDDYHSNYRAHTLNIYFIAKIKKGKIKPQDDILEAKFFKLNKLPCLCFKNGRDALKDYLKNVSKPKT